MCARSMVESKLTAPIHLLYYVHSHFSFFISLVPVHSIFGCVSSAHTGCIQFLCLQQQEQQQRRWC